MRVLVAPRVDLGEDAVAAAVARALAGADGEVVFLAQVGVSDLSCPLSQGEVGLIRGALRPPLATLGVGRPLAACRPWWGPGSQA
jgi:hypothetical protein